MTIYHQETCPICSQELVVLGNNIIDSFACDNKCYSLQIYKIGNKVNKIGNKVNRIIIFESVYDFGNIESKEIIRQIENKINYWKENDRYLIEILESSNKHYI